MNIVLTGVSGAGKSTLGRALARRLAARLYDVNDLDRCERDASSARSDASWLPLVAEVLRNPGPREHLVVACPALRRDQRDTLRRACVELRLVFIHPSSLTLTERHGIRRMQTRGRSWSLASQLRELEPPGMGEDALFVDNEGPVETVADRIVASFMLEVEPIGFILGRIDS